MPSTVLAIGRCARPCERARAEAGTAAADTARRSYRHSLISRVIATAAATSPRANRTITSARCAKQCAGSDTRLIPRHADADALRSASERSHGGHGSRGRGPVMLLGAADKRPVGMVASAYSMAVTRRPRLNRRIRW